MARTKSYCLKIKLIFDSEEVAFRNARILLQQKIPRPLNAFMLYANENRKAVAQMYPAESNKEISKRLGNNWKSLEMQLKTKYFDRAKVMDLEHKKKYPNYVYNPKEARIRKAMREATRDRSIGASPMLPRPSARRASHGWVGTHEEQLMMSPLAGMRGGLESPVCFPISTGTGSNQFLPPMNGYSKLESPINASSSVHSNFLQPNPLAQLQQQTDMWHNYQESMRPRSSGNPFILQDVPSYQHAGEVPNAMMMEKQHQRQTHSVGSSTMSMTPPHSNENVPPDEVNEKTSFENKHVLESVHPLMESNNMQQQAEAYMPVFGQNLVPPQQQPFDKVEEVKMKKPAIPQIRNNTKKQPSSKPLPDFNEAFGSTERGRFQSPPDPRLAPNKGYLDYFFDSPPVKFDDYQI